MATEKARYSAKSTALPEVSQQWNDANVCLALVLIALIVTQNAYVCAHTYTFLHVTHKSYVKRPYTGDWIDTSTNEISGTPEKSVLPLLNMYASNLMLTFL